MKQKHTNILRAGGRLVIAIISAAFARVVAVVFYFLRKEDSAVQKDEEFFGVESGMLVHKAGGQRAIVDTLDED